MNRYHQWRENVAYSSGRLRVIDSMLLEIIMQLRSTLGIQSAMTGIKSEEDICSMLGNASRRINELLFKADHELDIAEEKHESRKQCDGKTK